MQKQTFKWSRWIRKCQVLKTITFHFREGKDSPSQGSPFLMCTGADSCMKNQAEKYLKILKYKHKISSIVWVIFPSERLNFKKKKIKMNSLFPFSHSLCSFQRMFPLLPSSSTDLLSINFYIHGISQDIRILNPELNQIKKRVAILF